MVGCCFTLGVFGVHGIMGGPGGVVPGPQEPTKWKKLRYCKTIKIILYNFVIIFNKHLVKKIKSYL